MSTPVKTYKRASAPVVARLLVAKRQAFSEEDLAGVVKYLNGWRDCRTYDRLMSTLDGQWVLSLVKEIQAQFPDQRPEAAYQARDF